MIVYCQLHLVHYPNPVFDFFIFSKVSAQVSSFPFAIAREFFISSLKPLTISDHNALIVSSLEMEMHALIYSLLGQVILQNPKSLNRQISFLLLPFFVTIVGVLGVSLLVLFLTNVHNKDTIILPI